jgi:hypothetical protein
MSKNVIKEAEDGDEIRHQATIGEDTADQEDLMLDAVNCRVYELAFTL